MADSSSRPWGFTCPDCNHVPPRGGEPDYASWRVSRNEWRSMALHVPHRCRSCDSRKKRWTRMRRRVDRAFERSRSHGSTYARPKLITFALPSETSSCYTERYSQIALLNSRLPRAREILKSFNVRGGIYVIECTSRLLPLDGFGQADPFLERPGHLYEWKHHAHVHMVAVAPYMRPDKFRTFCECLIDMGLGRLNVEALGSDRYSYREARDKVSSYISKYLNKDGGRCRTFGSLRRTQND
jgi:hypothetical protein